MPSSYVHVPCKTKFRSTERFVAHVHGNCPVEWNGCEIATPVADRATELAGPAGATSKHIETAARERPRPRKSADGAMYRSPCLEPAKAQVRGTENEGFADTPSPRVGRPRKYRSNDERRRADRDRKKRARAQTAG